MSAKWDEFLYWAGRFRIDHCNFDGLERDYKIASAEKSLLARNAFEANESWIELIRKPLSVNLCNHYSAMAFRDWVEADTVALSSAIRRLWSEDLSPENRINGFLDFVPTDMKRSRLAEPALVLHMAMGVDQYPTYRPGTITTAFHMTDYPTFKDAELKGDYGMRYAYVLDFYDRVFDEATSRGIALRDRLDAQSFVWPVTYWVPLEKWSETDRSRFLEYRKQAIAKT